MNVLSDIFPCAAISLEMKPIDDHEMPELELIFVVN
jgi:hypothetical protein